MATNPPKRIANRPTGEDRTEYKGHPTWSYKRWSWEFLRRNAGFIAACKAAGRDPGLQSHVAQEYQLQRFKSCKEAWSNGDGRPRFASSTVTFHTSANNDDARQLRLRLNSGEVLFRVRLSTTIQDRQAVDAQLRAIEKIIRREQLIYRTHVGAEEAEVAQAKPQLFLRSLRIVDLLRGRNKDDTAVLGRALRIANRRSQESLTMDQVSPSDSVEDAIVYRECRKQVDQAFEMIDTGYRFLVTRAGRLSPKGFA